MITNCIKNNDSNNAYWIRLGLCSMSIFLLCLGGLKSQAPVVQLNETHVICANENVTLVDLDPNIIQNGGTGVNRWSIRQGDGYFNPGAVNVVSYASGIEYVPGPNDKAEGEFILLLVSGYEFPAGVNADVYREVTISIEDGIIGCTQHINISLAQNCSVDLTVADLLNSSTQNHEFYSLELKDENGIIIPNATINASHLNKTLEYKITRNCDGISCWGYITVEDKQAPQLFCRDHTVVCTTVIDPVALGLPIPATANFTRNTQDSSLFRVSGVDECTDIDLSYTDEKSSLLCQNNLIQTIQRRWTAVDDYGNQSSCTELIRLEALFIDDIEFPQNRDDLTLPSLNCESVWDTLPDGNPHPSETGYPIFEGCANFDATFTDTRFEACGAGFKIHRQWQLIEWCESLSRDESQIIKITDNSGPQFGEISDITTSTGYYDCVSPLFEISFPTDVVDCSDWSASLLIPDALHTTSITIDTNNKKILIEDLPLGSFNAIMELQDECLNRTRKNFIINVIDDIAPQAVCDHHTVASLVGDGTARVFATSIDDESYDNCDIDRMQVRKTSDRCSNNVSFRDYVDFCCEELGTSQTVIFRVWDTAGNYNDCTVEVEVQDELGPSILCPSNLTVACDFEYDLNDLSVFGKVVADINERQSIVIDGDIVGTDGVVLDNCGVNISETKNVNLECNTGTIRRTFTATDHQGNIDRCTQVITFQNNDPFVYDDIEWPRDTTIVGCYSDTADEQTGMPSFLMNNCSLVEAAFEDSEFEFAEGACKKLLRKWTVIDWCQFENIGDPGFWEEEQIIKFNESTEPEFVSSCSDTTICLYGSDCQETITLIADATDLCSSDADISYSWSVDYDNDGTIDNTGGGKAYSGTFSPSTNKIFWTIEDGCGNQASCSYLFTIQDCKKPTPYCLSSITTVSMQGDGTTLIWAADFDLGATDNCTDQDDLIISFDENGEETSLQLSCDDIPNGVSSTKGLEIWVTDLAGNKNNCRVELILQDNINTCEDQNVDINISGRITSPRDEAIEDVQVELQQHGSSENRVLASNSNGQFAFSQLEYNKDYDLDFSFDTDANSGINIQDMVIIQRHILGLREFSNPLQYLAADINQNNSISASDIVFIRKVILGLKTNFPSGYNWGFINEEDIVNDENQIWSMPRNSVSLSRVDHNIDLDVKLYKMGDANFSANPNFGQTEIRSNASADLSIDVKKQGNESILHISTDVRFEGVQFVLKFDEEIDLQNIKMHESLDGNSSYSLHSYGQNTLAFCWADVLASPIEAGESIMSIPLPKNYILDKNIVILSNDISNIAISHDESFDLQLRIQESTETNNISEPIAFSIAPNPFNNHVKIEIKSPLHEDHILQIIDPTGRVILNKAVKTNGQRMIDLDASNFQYAGIYMVKLSNSQEVVVHQMVKI